MTLSKFYSCFPCVLLIIIFDQATESQQWGVYLIKMPFKVYIYIHIYIFFH